MLYYNMLKKIKVLIICYYGDCVYNSKSKINIIKVFVSPVYL